MSVILLLGPEGHPEVMFCSWQWKISVASNGTLKVNGRMATQTPNLPGAVWHIPSVPIPLYQTMRGYHMAAKGLRKQYLAEKRLSSYRREAQIFRTQLAFSATTGKHFIIQLHVKENTLRNIYSIKSLL